MNGKETETKKGGNLKKYTTYIAKADKVRLFQTCFNLQKAQTIIATFNGKGEQMSISETSFMRYAVISETFTQSGQCTKHAMVLETDDAEEAHAAAERERHKAVNSIEDLPHVSILDRMKGVYTK